MHKRHVSLLLVIAFLFVFLFVGCGDTPSNDGPPKTIDKLSIPDDFTFRTTEVVTVTYDFGGNFSNIPIAIYGSAYDAFTTDQTIPDFMVGSGTTSDTGLLQTQVTVPLSCVTLVLIPNYIGLPGEIRIAKDDAIYISRALTAKKGSDPEYTFDSDDLPTRTPDPLRIKQSDNHWLFLNDEYTLDGIPKSLFTVELEKDFLKDINNSLFKRNKGIDDNVPTELTDGLTVGTLDMNATNKVWMTFIDEKAGFNNTLGYYTYETGNRPPKITPDLVTLVFPNASYGKGKDTYLESGDTVYIGEIAAGQSIGFVLITNGWFSRVKDTTGQVRKEGQGIYYSEADLNPKTEPHTSIIQYSDKVFLVGIEDNEHSEKDYNFNDVVFAVIVGDKDAVKKLGSHIIPTDFDEDDDGVIDSLDAYPDDATRTTKEVLTGTLAYEDLWPKLGDYDFNDLVVEYEYAIDGNKDNKIVSMEMKYTILASGASLPNGLALALPLKETTDFTISKISYSKNDTQTDAVVTKISKDEGSQILIFARQDDAKLMGERPFNTGTNSVLEPQSVSFTLTFTTPISKSDAKDRLGEAPYDVFMLVDNADSSFNPAKAGKEVHLIGYAPTTLANDVFLKEAEALKNKDYYKSERNLPFAIHIPGAWAHPLEKKSIVDGYNYFGTWAESGGEKYQDWYLGKEKYKNTSNLYKNT